MSSSGSQSLQTCSIVESSLVRDFRKYDRTFFKTYRVRVLGDGCGDFSYEIVMHSNGIGLIRLADNHVICRLATLDEADRIVAVHVPDAVQNIKCRGKSKQMCKKFTKPTDRICTIDVKLSTNEAPRSIPIHNCIFGKLLEVNSKLLENPLDFFRNSHSNRQYFAIIYLDCMPSKMQSIRDLLLNYFAKQSAIELISID